MRESLLLEIGRAAAALDAISRGENGAPIGGDEAIVSGIPGERRSTGCTSIDLENSLPYNVGRKLEREARLSNKTFKMMG